MGWLGPEVLSLSDKWVVLTDPRRVQSIQPQAAEWDGTKSGAGMLGMLNAWADSPSALLSMLEVGGVPTNLGAGELDKGKTGVWKSAGDRDC